MAAPQFFVPPKVTPSNKSKRRFTLEQANRTLPLVSRIVADIVRVHKNATSLQAQIEKPDKQRNAAVAEVDRELQSAKERLQTLLEELSDVGCELKDFQTGLVDFIGRHQNRDVYLCWKLGEANIEYWHELDAGFAGRQPISTLEEKQ